MIRLFGDLWAIKDIEITLEHLDLPLPRFAMANLETPLIEDVSNNYRQSKAGSHIHGCSKTLKTLSETLPYLKCLSLANNHAMDFGLKGLEQTIENCEKLNIGVVGAGCDARAASSPYIVNIDGIRVGILARCEKQFGSSSDTRGGVSSFDITLHRAIRQLKPTVDIVIVSIHAAAELSPWPSPSWQDQLRTLIDVGADVVHGHHSHVPQGWENYNEGLITYGLGNGLVIPSQWNHENTDWALVVDLLPNEVSIEHNIKISRLVEEGNKLTLKIEKIDEWSRYIDYVEKCNAPLHDRRLLEGIWQEISLRMYDAWYAEWLGILPLTSRYSRYTKWAMKSVFKSIARLTKLGKRYPPQSSLTYLLFACESHREVISTALGVLNGEIDDIRNERISTLVDEMMPWSIRY